MKKFFFMILLCQFVVSSYCHGQKDTLRWFIGHWENTKTFIIDSNMTGGAAGGRAIIGDDGSIRVTTPESKKFDNKLNDQVVEIDNEERNIQQKIKQDQGLYQYNLAMECSE